jgi:hypothetical protein
MLNSSLLEMKNDSNRQSKTRTLIDMSEPPLINCREPRAAFSAQSIFILCIMTVCVIVFVILLTSLALGIGLGVGLGNKITSATSG